MSQAMQKVEVLRAACCVAGADGKTTDAERRVLDKLAADVGVGFASLTAMIEQAETDQTFYKEQFRVLKSDPKQTMQLLFGVAVVDGELRRDEAAVLKRLADQLDVNGATFDKWLDEAVSYVKRKGQSGEA